MRNAVVATVIAVLLASGRISTQVTDGGGDASGSLQRIAAIPLREVRRIVDAATASPNVPPQLIATTASGWEDAWNEWLRQHQAKLRQRVDRGDEDSVANLWMYGTSFTPLPPARGRHLPVDGKDALDEVLANRLDDLLVALRSSSRQNERLAFVREFLVRHHADPATRQGREAARRLLVSARARARDEFVRTDAVLASVAQRDDRTAQLETVSTIFKDRGLSSDTSLLVDAGIDAALQALSASGALGVGGVRRVAVIGPGLDFVNKADGHDFYPQQTVQPFALIDSLLRNGLSNARDLQVTTIDVNPRVNRHLLSATARAWGGEPYLLHLPLPRTERWTPQVRAFWREVGDRISTAAKPMRVRDTDNADVRAINVRPDVVAMLDPVGADIVSSRLAASGDGLFDLIVSTNVFVYYSAFEQALAAANVASMLRGGGVLITNNDIPVVAPMKSSVGHLRISIQRSAIRSRLRVSTAIERLVRSR